MDGKSIFSTPATTESDAAFVSLGQKRPDALLVVGQGLFNNRRVQIVTKATHHALPTIYSVHDYAEIGGLMSYGSSPADQFRLTGIYTGRVLKGEKPADLPVLRASKFELVVNVQMAKVLGIAIPRCYPGLPNDRTDRGAIGAPR